MSAFRKLMARLGGRYSEVAALHDAYQDWCRNNCFPETSVFVARVVSQPSLARHFDKLRHDAGLVPVYLDGSFFLRAVHRRLFGQDEGGGDSADLFAHRVENGLKQPDVIGVSNETDCHFDDRLGQGHGHRLLSDEFNLRIHVILRGLIARIKAVLRGRVE